MTTIESLDMKIDTQTTALHQEISPTAMSCILLLAHCSLLMHRIPSALSILSSLPQLSSTVMALEITVKKLQSNRKMLGLGRPLSEHSVGGNRGMWGGEQPTAILCNRIEGDTGSGRNSTPGPLPSFTSTQTSTGEAQDIHNPRTSWRREGPLPSPF